MPLEYSCAEVANLDNVFPADAGEARARWILGLTMLGMSRLSEPSYAHSPESRDAETMPPLTSRRRWNLIGEEDESLDDDRAEPHVRLGDLRMAQGIRPRRSGITGQRLSRSSS